MNLPSRDYFIISRTFSSDFRLSQACLHSRHCCSRKAGLRSLASTELQVVLLYYLGPSEAIARGDPGDKLAQIHLTSPKIIYFHPNTAHLDIFLVTQVFVQEQTPMPRRSTRLLFWSRCASRWQVRIKEDTVIVYVNDACDFELQAVLRITIIIIVLLLLMMIIIIIIIIIIVVVNLFLFSVFFPGG